MIHQTQTKKNYETKKTGTVYKKLLFFFSLHFFLSIGSQTGALIKASHIVDKNC